MPDLNGRVGLCVGEGGVSKVGVLINCFYQTVPPLNSAKGSGQTFDSVLAIITRLKFTPKVCNRNFNKQLNSFKMYG